MLRVGRIVMVCAIKQEAKLDLNSIITELKTERDRIGRAIAALLEDAKVAVSGTVRRAGAPKRRRGGITAAGRRRLSQAMKRRWAERRMGKTTGRSEEHTSALQSLRHLVCRLLL